MYNWIRYSTAILLGSLSLSAYGQPQTFTQYVQGLRQEFLEQGYSKAVVSTAFDGVRLRPQAIQRDKNQPEFRLTLDSYIPRALPQWKVDKARNLYKEHLPLLKTIAKKYGVQPRFIVALWGVESNFGKLTGQYDVMSALTSLAYQGRREAFFKRQIGDVLSMLEEDNITRDQLKGSWAGAMGQVQFMPGTYREYAVDQDQDGKKDIWNDIPDALASAANYLQHLNWHDNMTWGRQVRLPTSLDLNTLDLKQTRSLVQWQALGVRRYNGQDLPQRDMQARLLVPDDLKGRIYLVYDNFESLLKWNRSNYFAITVGILANQIGYPPIKE
ncbi:lytic transglycosylase domain-containing protein [Celerinatantimonas sp. YJH-8]|uniref:lytic murein transglycosylase n=1 Tax=Celerinatantimonas sp. YJH-8 TaxID=3228714 RepID=UPI0038CAC42B